MALWSLFTDLLQAGLFAATQACAGNLGAGIVVMSFAARLALLPITYAMARATYRSAKILQRLQPELERLRRQYRADPSRMAAEHSRLLRQHGLSLLDARQLLGAAVHAPVVAGMYKVVRDTLALSGAGRFLWIRNITRPDLLLAVLVAGITYTVALLTPQLSQQATRLFAVMSVGATFLILLKLSAGFGLYWGATSVVGAIQGLLLRRARAAV